MKKILSILTILLVVTSCKLIQKNKLENTPYYGEDTQMSISIVYDEPLFTDTTKHFLLVYENIYDKNDTNSFYTPIYNDSRDSLDKGGFGNYKLKRIVKGVYLGETEPR